MGIGWAGRSPSAGAEGASARPLIRAQVTNAPTRAITAPSRSPLPRAYTNASRIAAATRAGTCPVGAPPEVSASASRPRCLAGSDGSRSPRREPPSPLTSAPITATPKVPPIIRLIDRVPEATPALVRSTAFIAAVVIGDMSRPIPMPISTNPGSSSP